ncbi:MAG: 1-deoxy-D-xylulose-5-phosphate synthase [Ruminococcaceae bacterium]|nr:1-deoxy-D-xylulose-5-phosphate synthase [Oscillospiraceae bacterium]
MKILPKIKSPKDIRELDKTELSVLSEEIRKTIIETTSKNGGHLASNLGMVEATLAIHRVFDCPNDAVIFDVGHQAYAHKLITGRYDGFSTLRQAGGISGFTNYEESEYDTTIAGHSGTSISTAVGIAEADRIADRKSHTVAVIGDGSFTGGMVYEALNQVASKKLRLVIILNDNEMSISKNVGGLSTYLSGIRTSAGYFNFKLWLKTVFSKIPLIGDGCISAARAVKNFIKRVLGSETFFESLGIRYIGPVNGNDIDRLTDVLEEAKSKNEPVIVHMITKKGLGFEPAEVRPDRYHSTSGFKIDYLEPQENSAEAKAAKRTFADEFSEKICEFAEDDDRICAITAAMTDGCGLKKYSGMFSERFFDVGIAEEHAVAMAGGLALRGQIPVTVLYSTFSQRVFDQMWHDVALQKAHIVLCLSHAGLVPGDGITHQGVYDVGLFSPLPNVTIYSPDTFADFDESLETSISGEGICIVRYPKDGENVYDVEFDDHGSWKSCDFGDGERTVTVVTYGRITKNVISAIRKIIADDADLRVQLIVLRKIVPLPESDDLKFYGAVNGAEHLVFVEEVKRRGGVGEMLASHESVEKKVSVIAIEEDRIPHGKTDQLMRYVGLDSESIAEKVKKIIK